MQALTLAAAGGKSWTTSADDMSVLTLGAFICVEIKWSSSQANTLLQDPIMHYLATRVLSVWSLFHSRECTILCLQTFVCKDL